MDQIQQKIENNDQLQQALEQASNNQNITQQTNSIKIDPNNDFANKQLFVLTKSFKQNLSKIANDIAKLQQATQCQQLTLSVNDLVDQNSSMLTMHESMKQLLKQLTQKNNNIDGDVIIQLNQQDIQLQKQINEKHTIHSLMRSSKKKMKDCQQEKGDSTTSQDEDQYYSSSSGSKSSLDSSSYMKNKKKDNFQEGVEQQEEYINCDRRYKNPLDPNNINNNYNPSNFKKIKVDEEHSLMQMINHDMLQNTKNLTFKQKEKENMQNYERLMNLGRTCKVCNFYYKNGRQVFQYRSSFGKEALKENNEQVQITKNSKFNTCKQCIKHSKKSVHKLCQCVTCFADFPNQYQNFSKLASNESQTKFVYLKQCKQCEINNPNAETQILKFKLKLFQNNVFDTKEMNISKIQKYDKTKRYYAGNFDQPRKCKQCEVDYPNTVDYFSRNGAVFQYKTNGVYHQNFFLICKRCQNYAFKSYNFKCKNKQQNKSVNKNITIEKLELF